EIWNDAGIPFAIELPRPVTAVPLIKAIMGLLQLLVEDWRYPAVKKLLRAGSVYNPEAFPRVNEILTLLRQLNWRGSRSELLDDLQLMRSRCEPESEQEILLQSALNLFEMLDHLCQKFPQRASCQEFTQHLLAFARETFFGELNPALESAREQSAEWDLIVGMFHDASNFQDELSGSETRELSREDYLEWIEDQCLTQQIAATRAKPHQVAIVNANDARHMRVDHLFVMNLQEGVFPSSAEHQPFYTERERSQWNELGIPLDQRSSHYYDEMQFFYRLLTRAQRSLTLSYSYVSTSGQPLYASPFYQAVQSLFDKTAGIETRIDQLSPLPERNELLTQSDLRIFGMSRMHLGEAGLMRFLWESESSRQTIENVLGAVRMNAARFEQHGFTAYEGLLENPSIQEEIGNHYHTRYPFSASQLERYSSCPFRFFLERILQLESIESPRLRTDSRRRGVVIHDLLATLHQPEETDEQPEQSLGERFSQLIQERYQRSFSHNELQNVLLEVEQRLLTEWADLYEENHGLYEALFDDGWESPFRPEHQELAFGGDAERETSQKLPAVPFGPAENPVYVEGRIDRIDVTTQGERTYFSLIDYKTGALPDVSDKLVERGISLQLTLYTIAIVRLELLGPGAVPWQIGYWDLKEKGFQRKMTNLRKKNIDPLGQEFVDRMSETLDRVLPEIISRLRKAEFPVISFDHQCTAHCPYHMTCRINQVRAVAEPLEKRWGWITESEETKQLEQ
ncbi:MAG: PD-(D/E)XK nuclease family protein, partial [Planctomycetaceae bacterium]|nr:PD-(D/E)XK nuclease family protein [Planctomycetaceae bacterium]